MYGYVFCRSCDRTALFYVMSVPHTPSLFLQITHPSQIGVVVGDTVNVKYLGKDFLGKHLVSRKALTEPPPKPDVVRTMLVTKLQCT